MARKPKAPAGKKQVTALKHDEATRKNLATAELAAVAESMEEKKPVAPVHYSRARPLARGHVWDRDPDLDPQIVWNGARIRLSPDQLHQLQEKSEVEIGDAQLVWHGKDRQDWSDLVVQPPQLYIQEKIHSKAIIDDLIRRSQRAAVEKNDAPDLFADFNGLTDPQARLEFYEHDQHWSNRMILGDSLLVMASLAERERLRGQVQCIYIDPPYGISFNSNWQVSTLSRTVKDGKRDDISREPEQIRAFRDTWKDGIHSYLTYLRDRLTIARELLTDSGSIFVQIGDRNVHRVRAVLDEVFGDENAGPTIDYKTTSGLASDFLPGSTDHLVWYFKNRSHAKFRQLYNVKTPGAEGATQYNFIQSPDASQVKPFDHAEDTIEPGWKMLAHDNLTSTGHATTTNFPLQFQGREFLLQAANLRWKTTQVGIRRLDRASRLLLMGSTLRYRRLLDDFPVYPIVDLWTDTGISGFADRKVFIVQTTPLVVQRCVLMTTDPGDLVLDPTCGSGTTAYVAEQWGRRWITIDTSRVALALARARIMGARYPYYYLADTREGRAREQGVSAKIQPDTPMLGDIRQGFVYERAPHITLRSIANNAEIDVIWETFQPQLDFLRAELNAALGTSWEEWDVPREGHASWSEKVKELHQSWSQERAARQRKMDASIAKNAEVELLYDRPYEDKSRVRVTGPFTIESLSPHRVVTGDEEEPTEAGETSDGKRRRSKLVTPPTDFAEIVLEHLRTFGVQQSAKKDAIKFTSLQGWPGEYIGAEGRFTETQTERRAAIFLGPEFGTISRVDLVAAAREATEARFDALIACAFNFDAHASELSKLGPLPILKAKMNPDLHMADELKNTGKGNLFVVFGEPDIDIEYERDGRVRVHVKGVDVFDPNTGEIRSNDTEGIAAWFIDTDYDEQNFFVRHAYFLGAQDPYKSLKADLKAEVDADAWETLYSDTSRPFLRPDTGRIAVKVINHFGDEVMKVFSV